jgi:tRNA dimethylallyltransferase
MLDSTNIPKAIAIMGPTAIGKSELAVDLAEKIDAWIINVDSMQVYKEMNAGTAKPEPELRSRVPHYMIDITSVFEEYNVYQYLQQVEKVIEHIYSEDHPIIFCGGTGLYYKAIFNGLFPGPGTDKKIRSQLKAEIAAFGLQKLYDELKQIDPIAARLYPASDERRIIRSLEVFRQTGKPISQYWDQTKGLNINCEQWLLSTEREYLYQRINERCEKLINQGIIDESKSLLETGLELDSVPFQAIGYRQSVQLINGKLTIEEFEELFKRETRRFAKRQLTMFRGFEGAQWVNRFDPKLLSRMIEDAKIFFGL